MIGRSLLTRRELHSSGSAGNIALTRRGVLAISTMLMKSVIGLEEFFTVLMVGLVRSIIGFEQFFTVLIAGLVAIGRWTVTG